MVMRKSPTEGICPLKVIALNSAEAKTVNASNTGSFLSRGTPFFCFQLCVQMFEMGSLLRDLARQYDATPVGLFGSLKNIAQFLWD